MRIDLNLSVAESLRDRYALAWAIPATVVGLAGVALLGVSLVREFREYRNVERQVQEIEQRENQLRNQEAAMRRDLDKPDHRDLLLRVRFVNALIERKQLSLAGMAQRLTDLMPEEVHLTAWVLATQGDDLVVRLGLTGKNEEAIEKFMGDLEDAPDFKDVTITNQGFQVESAQPGQVNVTCTARYVPGEE